MTPMNRIQEIDTELAEIQRQLGQLPAQAIQTSPAEPKMPQQRVAEIDEELAAIQQQLGEEPLTLTQRLLQAPRGLAHGIGSMVDLAGTGISKGLESGIEVQKNLEQQLAAKAGSKTPEEMLARREELNTLKQPGLMDLDVANKLTSPIDTLADANLAPREGDTLGQVLHGIGEFATPMPYLSVFKVGKKGIELAKQSLKKAAGASALVHGTPHMTEEGGLGRFGEDMLKAILGSAAGNKIASKAMLETVKEFPEKLKNILPASKKYLMEKGAKLFTMGAEPQKEVLDIAKKEGIKLPFNIGLQSRALDFLQQNYFKHIFTSKVYKDAMEGSAEDVVNSVNKSLDKLGKTNLKPHESSQAYRAFLTQEQEGLKKQASKLYNEAGEHLKPTDKVKTSGIVSYINDVKDQLKSLHYSAETKKVLQVFNDLAVAMGISKPKVPELLEKAPHEYIESIMKQFEKAHAPEVNANVLYNTLKELNKTTEYGIKNEGTFNFLNGLRKAVDADLHTLPNKAYIERLDTAREFFKQNVADRFKGDIARSILTSDAPMEAYSAMGTVDGIQAVKEAAGNTKKGKAVFNTLAKAKARELLGKAADEEMVRPGAFVKIFEKGEKQQEVLTKLIGEKEYKRLEQISKIAKEFKKAGASVLNTSGTAIASESTNSVKQIIWSSFELAFGGLSGGSVLGPLGSLAGAAVTGVAAPNLLSRLMANPEFVEMMRSYALARQAGKEPAARNILNRMIKFAEPEAKQALVVATEHAKEKENE